MKPQAKSSKSTGSNGSSNDDKTSKKRARGSRTSTACEACKRRKTKCSGAQPCELCITLGTECVIDYSLDMRRRSAMQRALGETKTYQHTLETLVDIVRGEDQDRLNEVIDFIRQQSSTQLAATALRDSILAGQPGPSSSAGTQQVSGSDSQSGEFNFAESNLTSPVSLTGASIHLLQRYWTQWPLDEPSHFQSPTSSLYDPRSAQEIEKDTAKRRHWHVSLQLPERTDYSQPFRKHHHMMVESPEDQSPDQNANGEFGTFHAHQLQDAIEVRLPLQFGEPEDGLPRGEDFPRVIIPIHLVQPHAIVDDSVLSRVYTDFLRAARHMVQNGKSTADLISGKDIMVDLFYRPRREDDPFTSCSWASEVVRGLTELDEFMRLGWVVLLCPLMRWLLMPTEETYSNVPEMIRPTCAQRSISHVAGIDVCPIPVLREMLINGHCDWMTALVESRVSVNWPYGREGALEKSPQGHLRLTERFKKHVVVYKNWSVTRRILEWFPGLEGRIRMVRDSEDVVDHTAAMQHENRDEAAVKGERDEDMKYFERMSITRDGLTP